MKFLMQLKSYKPVLYQYKKFRVLIFVQTIFFAEPPPTPGNLSILEISSRSVKVSWTIEAASPRVERLVVQWKERSGQIMEKAKLSRII